MSFAISFEAHTQICNELRQQIHDLLVENEQLRHALIKLRETECPGNSHTPQPQVGGNSGSQ